MNQYAIVPRDGKLHLRTPQGQLQTNIQPQSEAAALFCQLIEKVNQGNSAAIARFEQVLPQMIEAQREAYGTAIAAKDDHLSSLKEEVAYYRTQNLELTKAIAQPDRRSSDTSITVEVSGGWTDDRGLATFAIVMAILVTATFITSFAYTRELFLRQSQPQGQGVKYERSI